MFRLPHSISYCNKHNFCWPFGHAPLINPLPNCVYCGIEIEKVK